MHGLAVRLVVAVDRCEVHSNNTGSRWPIVPLISLAREEEAVNFH